jgi:cysteine desulfurase/selenocysteine lyase
MAEAGKAALDYRTLRGDFPALAQRINGQPLVYLDNAATTQKPQLVIDETVRAYTEYCANVERGAHTLGARATAVYEGVRQTVRRFLNAAHIDEVLFSSGCTAAINFVAQAWGDVHLMPGDEVLVSELEHHSNLLPWQALCQRRGARLRFIPIDERGVLRLETHPEWLSPRTRLVAVAHVSNALGTLNPVREIVELAHGIGAKILVDGAQAVSRCPVDVRALDCDFYAFSAHKLYGPFGVGVLYAKRDMLAGLSPPMTGGGMVEWVDPEVSRFAESPRRFEAGTPNLAGVAGLGAAIRYLENVGLDAVMAHDRSLVESARRALRSEPGVCLIGEAADCLGVVSFAVEGIHPHDVSTVLDGAGVAVRAGHHCAQLVMRRFGVAATVRASFALYNGEPDIDTLVLGLRRARELLGT